MAKSKTWYIAKIDNGEYSSQQRLNQALGRSKLTKPAKRAIAEYYEQSLNKAALSAHRDSQNKEIASIELELESKTPPLIFPETKNDASMERLLTCYDCVHKYATLEGISLDKAFINLTWMHRFVNTIQKMESVGVDGQ